MKKSIIKIKMYSPPYGKVPLDKFINNKIFSMSVDNLNKYRMISMLLISNLNTNAVVNSKDCQGNQKPVVRIC